MFALKIWGCRGGIASGCYNDEEEGIKFSSIKYGAATSCYEIRINKQTIIVDMGTGARALGNTLLKKAGKNPINAIVFFTHAHWDHIQGFPYFKPFFWSKNSFSLFGPHKTKISKPVNTTLETILAGQQMYPNFPVQLQEMTATLKFTDIGEGTKLKFRKNPTDGEYKALEDFNVLPIGLSHPDGCFGYRFEYKKHAIVIATDNEHFSEINTNITKLAKNADVMVLDAQYTDEQYKTRLGWGHSTPEMAVREAEAANVKHLLITHHDPDNDDDELDRREKSIKSEKLKVEFAKERMLVKVLD